MRINILKRPVCAVGKAERFDPVIAAIARSDEEITDRDAVASSGDPNNKIDRTDAQEADLLWPNARAKTQFVDI